MATDKNLNTELRSPASDLLPSFWYKKRIAIVVARWNAEITDKLLEGAKQTLLDNGLFEENISVDFVPGAFELPLAVHKICRRQDGHYGIPNGIIAIGSVIRGETPHFDYVCQGVTQGIQNAMIKHGIPVSFCVLTDNTAEQARERSGGKYGNKGIESALACMEMIAFDFSTRNSPLAINPNRFWTNSEQH